ncbi:hypothetical protein ACN28E_27135 [Archangium lansingense]|uniref:hypothetical protein n=1 Tax=Archangium lansingense TaxID=2995310 RepID=UPI003B7C0419
MKKLPVLVATCVLGLSACASSSTARPGNVGDYLNEVDVARRDRMNAPTVYNGEATGAAGYLVTTDDGRVWAPEVPPGNTVTMTPSDVRRAVEEWENTLSSVTDEGPTESAPQQ